METLLETDLIKVPLRLYLWLLVPAIAGVGIGGAVANRAVHATGSAHASAAAPAATVVTAQTAPLPPRRIYRPAHVRVGLTPLRATPTTLAATRIEGTLPYAPSETVARAAGNVVTFDAQPRSFAEDSQTATTFDTSTPAQEPQAPANTTPILISDVHTLSLTPFSATVAFKTTEPVYGHVGYGLDAETLWSAWDSPSVQHVAVVNGLTYNMTYRLWLTARSADGRTATAPFLLTTPALSGSLEGSTGGGAFLVGGQQFFPTMVWSACSDSFDAKLAVGIDLFMGKDCGAPDKQISALADRGLFVGDAKDPAASGAVGSFLPDEWDTFLPNDIAASAVQRLVPSNGGGPRFLTLTNHFYSVAAPLPQGRGMYPALIANADVVGFDLYPLQNWCRYDDFGHVFQAQRELVQLAAGKPTFQWIEARHMDCKDPTLDPTPDTVRAETWLAIAGGAHAIGYFPYYWAPEVGTEIARDKREIQSLVPALLDNAIEADGGSGPIKVGARLHNGAIYVIAVNASRSQATATISVPALGQRQLTSLDRTRFVTPQNGAFTDTFAPLEVRVYIAAPTNP